MINNDKLKKVAIIFLIAVFSIVGIVACGGADAVTGSGSSYTQTTEPGNPEQTTETTFAASTYYKIRVPFAVGGDGYTNVSYQDTNTLKQLWFDQINRKAVNDGKVFAIRNRANNRNADNFQNRHTHGSWSAEDYYYFNENGDIVYKDDNTTIKKFVGAIITPYRDVSIERGNKTLFGNHDNTQAIEKDGITWIDKDIYTVGAIYANTLTTEEARSKYAVENPFKDGVYDFITYRHQVETWFLGLYHANNLFERQYINPGFIEVLVMYDYNNAGYDGAASVHSYYAYYGIYNYHEEYKNHPGIYFTPRNMPYMTNQNIYLGQKPEFITRQLNHSAVFTDTFRYWEFLFMPGHPN